MESSRVQLHHKEEGKARIEADRKDRDGLGRRLDSCIDPLDPKQHPDRSTVNTVNGKITPAFVNVENSVLIGEGMLEDFEKTWPEGFYSTIFKKVKTMLASRKSVQIGDSKVYDLNAIYSRVIALLSSPMSLHLSQQQCSQKKGMRLGKSKHIVKRLLHVEVSGDADITDIDGSISFALDCTLVYGWLRNRFRRECQEKDSFIPDKQWRLSHLRQISWV